MFAQHRWHWWSLHPIGFTIAVGLADQQDLVPGADRLGGQADHPLLLGPADVPGDEAVLPRADHGGGSGRGHLGNDLSVHERNRPLAHLHLTSRGRETRETNCGVARRILSAGIPKQRTPAPLRFRGVVRLEEDAGDPREWRCLPAAGRLRVREPLPGGDQPAGAIPAGVAAQFNQAFREAGEGLYGQTFQMSVNHNRARLSEEQAAEFGRRLLALIEEYFPPGKGDRSGIKYGFHGVLTPIDLHPLGDSETGE